MTVSHDPRRGLPSASGIEQMALCPGSWTAQKGLPEEQSKVSETGDRIHAAVAGEIEDDDLPVNEVDTAEKIREIEASIIATVFGAEAVIEEDIQEKRLWATENDEPLFSAQLDRLVIVGGTALILDRKTGWIPATEAQANLQLRAQAIVVNHNYEVSRVIVGIVQPTMREKFTLCAYSRVELWAADVQVREIIAGATMPQAPRRPSLKACRYCKAKAHCPEARAQVERLAITTIHSGNEVLSNEDLAALMDRVELAEKICGGIRGELKRRLESGEAVPGFRLKAGSPREKITNPNLVFGRFIEAGGTAEQFIPCVTVGKTKLKEAVRAATNTKGKALDEKLDGLLVGATESKASAPSVERIKP